jgi:predicted acetyltransferase
VELRHPTPDDVDEAARVFVASLGAAPPEEPERFGQYWDLDSSLVAVADDGRVLGVAARFPSQLTVVGGTAVRCTAVPSVGVRPDAHGRGVGRALLERQVVDAAALGDAVMALNASEVQIYGRYGYGPTSSWWSVEADPRTLRWRDDAPSAAPDAVEEVDDETAHRLLPDLHTRCFGRWAGELARPDGWWSMALRRRPDRPPNTFALLRDEDGTVAAAAIFTVKQHFDDLGFANEVQLRDLVGRDPATEALLLRWLLERRLVGRVVVERCSPRTPIKWMLEDGRRLRTTAAEDAVWVRVLDVPATVTARTTLASGAVVVEVRDRLVATNARRWRIAATGDGRLSCEPSDAAPGVVLDVGLLAPVLWGYTSPSRLAHAGRLTVHDPDGLATLDRLLAVTEPSWCATGF